MNIILHNIKKYNIEYGDTLDEPLNEKDGRLIQFDRVIANPPFSQNYDKATMQYQSRFSYGFAPETGKKGDLMFVQHMLASCKKTGKVVVVMPHGVLFRGGKEKEIREAMLKANVLEGIISLPPQLFYGTGIPACIMIFNKNKLYVLYKIYFYITQIICIFPQKKMGRSTRKISGYSSSEIKALFKTEDKYKIRIRLYAVYQISLGKPSRELEVLYNTSFKQILNWASRFEKEGIEGLRDKKGRGRKSKLTDAQKEQLKEVVLKKSPENYGYNTSTWNGPLLIDWLNKHMGVFYQRAQIYNVLKSLGLTYQKSKGFYIEADKEKQSIFKETLKKTS